MATLRHSLLVTIRLLILIANHFKKRFILIKIAKNPLLVELIKYNCTQSPIFIPVML